MFVNIYYFFFRRWCILSSFRNLYQDILHIKGAARRITYADMQQALEIIIILFIANCQMMPGGHQNFQLWYIDLVPAAMLMTNMHPLFFFRVFQDFYPGQLTPWPGTNQKSDAEHHIFSLMIVGYLLIFKGNIKRK